jgi:GDP-4-dehydro-6-deoxy-D-mannose reductase
MPEVLVTGASGFVGPYLVAALEARGKQVVAPAGGAALDLTDRLAVDRFVREVAPAEVYHLAALSSVAASFDDPTPAYAVNVMGTLHLLDAVRKHAPQARVLVVSSAEVYGGSAPRLFEHSPLLPASPYAASKAAAEMIAIQHARAYGLHVVRARAFNHTGPGQAARFAVSAFARQIARIEVGRQDPVLGVGNLAARRDFLDVRDVVEAYLALVGAGQAGAVYNVCSGRAIALQELLDGLLAHAKVGITVERDPALFRPLDVPEVCGDPGAIHAATGWQARIPLEKTLADVLAYWRAQEPFVGDATSNLA